MPRSSKSSVSVMGTRRSNRLSSRKVKRDASSVAQDVAKSKRREREYSRNSTICTSGVAKDLRRSLRITPAELVRREKVLLAREQEYKCKLNELNERTSLLSKTEDQVASKLSQIAERDAQVTLNQLDEHFTCPLCYEIMAHPFSLSPAQCGHTFCATCILKWFFSRLHRPCGGWHEPVDCPMCRTNLVATPERPPRSTMTFPFVPNRIASSMLESLLQKLARPTLVTVIKKEDIEALWVSVPGQTCTLDYLRRSSKAKDEFGSPDVVLWREGGCLRAEWLKKDREGRREMSDLLQRWETLEPEHFIELKLKFGV